MKCSGKGRADFGVVPAHTGETASTSVEWQALFHQALLPAAVVDLRGRFMHVNEALCRLLGFEEAELLARDLWEMSYPGAEAPRCPSADDMIAEGRLVLEQRLVRSDGGIIWVRLSLVAITKDGGSPSQILAQAEDITAQHRSEALWRESFANAPIGMALLDLDGRWTAVNDALCDLLGYSREELISTRSSEVTYPADQNHELAAYRALIDEYAETVSVEIRCRHKDGHPMTVLIRANTVPGADGKPSFVISQYEAIGNGRMTDAHLAHLALHDPLTGLANRALLTDRFTHELESLGRGGGVLAVLVADLDGLKPVNDRFGHAAGDQLLTAAAHEILQAVRSGDTVARLGGDEFVVVSLVETAEDAEALRARVAQCLDTQVARSGTRIPLHGSVGLAITRDASASHNSLLHTADQDMYARKKQHRSAA